jgi:hypothetical protein
VLEGHFRRYPATYIVGANANPDAHFAVMLLGTATKNNKKNEKKNRIMPFWEYFWQILVAKNEI